ncbi:MAG: signal recognition particle protein [Clostridiales bacterium]|nr:signal recognition particle protein [Clostridiales bacterium]
MFENLQETLTKALDKIKGYGKITEDNIKDVLREIKISLLEADVNYQIVKEFVETVKEKSLGKEVQSSIKPSEMFVKIVHDEIVNLLGKEKADLVTNKNPNILMLIGLQGTGKTTTAGKLATFLRKKYNKKPLLVACDVYRPAAIEQLDQLAKQINIPIYKEDSKDPVQIAKNSISYAKENNLDYIIIDTAGRLQIDEKLVEELKNINKEVNPHEILLVLDSMMGQDGVNVIKGFKEELNITGVILTKLDGDTRGGIALSLRKLTDVPIKFIGISEKMDGLSYFDPERMANRILGMGDIVSLVEKAEELISEKEAKELSKKMEKGKFDLDDFLKQMKTMKKLGSIEGILKLIPGASKLGLNNIKIDPKDILHVEAIILSMTKEERRNPDIIKASRKQRIAKGSGRTVQEVNRLLTNFEQTQKMMKQFKSGNFKLPF